MSVAQLDMFDTRGSVPHGHAVVSVCLRYRYVLVRHLASEDTQRVIFMMLNPSTADAVRNDPTIRRCVGFAERFGATSMSVLNLFGWRATKPQKLMEADDPVGPENDRNIIEHLEQAPPGPVVVAWGHLPSKKLEWRIDQVRPFLRDCGRDVFCLNYTKTGQPRHPLMLAYTTPLEAWTP